MFFVYAFSPEVFTIYSFLCLGGILLFLLLRPYKNDFYNKLDASMFCLLVAINTLTMYIGNKMAIGRRPSLFVFIIQYILILLPLVYISFVVMAYLCRCCKRQRHAVGNDGEVIANNKDELQEGSNNFLPFVEQMGRIHDVNMYHPVTAGSNSGDSERQSLISRTPSSVQPYSNSQDTPRYLADKP